MRDQDPNGILMQGTGRWLVYGRARAWLGIKLEIPGLLGGISIPRGASCLDIASGLGWAAAGLFRRDSSARIVAFEYDGMILPQTREYLRKHGVGSSVTLCRGDGKHLPFRNGSFDLVLCLYGLHHFRGYLDALREIARVLKPTGAFALIDPIRRQGKPPGGHHGTEVPTRDELDRMLDSAGLETVMSRVSFGTVKAVTHKRQSGTLPT
jgi:ubiquinone/menaquinone biosynthesis C-methylase UbiE